MNGRIDLKNTITVLSHDEARAKICSKNDPTAAQLEAIEKECETNQRAADARQLAEGFGGIALDERDNEADFKECFEMIEKS